MIRRSKSQPLAKVAARNSFMRAKASPTQDARPQVAKERAVEVEKAAKPELEPASKADSKRWVWIIAAAAFLLPLALSCARIGAGVQWSGDLPSVRDQGLAVVQGGGAASLALTQLFSFLPLGTPSFRAALVSAVATAIGSLMLMRLAMRILSQRHSRPSSLMALLAAVGAVMASLSPTWQVEATVGGSAMVAVTLVLIGCERVAAATSKRGAPSLTPQTTHNWLIIAAIAGVCLAERMQAGVALLVVVGITALSAKRKPPTRLLRPFVSVCLLVFAAGSAPLLLRPFAPGGMGDVAQALSWGNLDALNVQATQKLAVLAWISEVGVVSLLLSGLGVGINLMRGNRSSVTPLIMLVLVDLTYPALAASSLISDSLVALRCLALGSFCVAASLGVAELVFILRTLKVPMARTASVLVVMFHMTIVAVTCEEAAFAADRSAHTTTEEWTDAALEGLPQGAAVLVHSPQLTWRLWAAQLVHGQRPDVIVIPSSLLNHVEVMNKLLPREPQLTQLLRDYALKGQASEYGLSIVADARPLLVELDKDWNARIVSHLKVDGPWLRYSPQVLGPSDRKSKAVHVLSQAGRIGGQLDNQLGASKSPDAVSAQVVAGTLKKHAAVFSLVGMSAAAEPLIVGIEQLAPKDPFVTSARLRLAYAARLKRATRPVELRDLLRY